MKKVLVVDDEKMNLRLVERMLKCDYDVATASSGKEALDRIEEEKPDLILLDILMPQMDGFETLEAIRGLAGWQDVPILFLTADTGEDVRAKAREAGVSGIVEKPFKKDVFLEEVRACIG